MKLIFSLVLVVSLLSCSKHLSTSKTPDGAGARFEQAGYTLLFESNDPKFDPKIKSRLVETFFIVYPKLAKDFNPQTAKEVIFKVDTAYKGVAATSGGRVVYNPGWFRQHPGDIDVVTHEVMHIVQSYGNSAGPWWVTEGIADYVRDKYGVDNAGAGWSLPNLDTTKHKYTDSYRVTARFFKWIEAKVKPGTIKAINANLRDHSYTADDWKKLTGKTLDELWEDYKLDPRI